MPDRKDKKGLKLLKNRLSYFTDSGQELGLLRELYQNTYTDFKSSDCSVQKIQKLEWRHMTFHSGAIGQPWYDKLQRIRRP